MYLKKKISPFALAVALGCGLATGYAPSLLAEGPVASAEQSNVLRATLDNGLRVFVLERRASPTFAGYYRFAVGGAMDPKGRTGTAHLLEQDRIARDALA